MAALRRYAIPGLGLGVVILTAFAVVTVRGTRSEAGNGPAAGREHSPRPPTPIRAEGRIVTYPGATVEVRSEINGRLVELRVREQEQVRRGELLAAVAAEEFQAALAETEGQIAAADADTAWLATELQRITRLARTGSVSRQTLDRTTHDLAEARAHRQVAEATARRLKAVIAKTRIVAPIAGTIVTRSVDIGEVVGSGMELMTIIDLHQRRVEAEVDEYDAGRVQLGDTATITAEGDGAQRWMGTVESVPDVMVPRRVKPQDPGRFSDTRVLAVKITVPADAPLRIGQRVEVAIHVR